jgi:hypothetical protein
MKWAAAALLLAAAGAARAQDGTEAWPGLIVPGGTFVLFYDSEGTLSYPAPTPLDVPKDAVQMGEVKGKACQYQLNVPLLSSLGTFSGSAGRGGYKDVFKKMRKTYPGLRGLYDVKVDDHEITLLGLFERLCTEVTAYGFR